MKVPLDQAVERWRSAENRLYPVVMTRPDLYEQSLTAVRGIANSLRSAGTVDELLEAYDRAPELVAEIVRHGDLPSEGLDMGLITGAAFSLRYRELVEETNRAEARNRIHVGRESGAEWVAIYETGGNTLPYRRLEMHLSTGTGLHAFIEMDPDTGGPLFGVEVVQLDPQTGDWVTDVPPLSERQVFADRQSWDRAIQNLRDRDQTES